MVTQQTQDTVGARYAPHAPHSIAGSDEREDFRYQRGRSARASGPPIDAWALGCVSLGLGATALLAPRPLGRLMGIGEADTLLRLVGCRELASGVGLLAQRRKAPWLWSRVAGDVMDLVLVGSAARRGNSARQRVWATVGVLGAMTAVDLAASVRAARIGARTASAGASISEALIVNKSPQECYEFWRNTANLARFTSALESISSIDERRSRWLIRGPLRTKLEWIAEITVDEPASHIGWRSIEGSQVDHAGVVRFVAAAGGRGTLVRVSMHYRPLGGRAGIGLGKLVGGYPRFQVREDLRRFKQLIETGEIPTTRGQSAGRRSVFGRTMRAGGLLATGRPQ